MKWWGVGRLAAIVAALCVGGPACEAAAQSFGLRLERGEVGVDGRGRQQLGGVASGSMTTDYQQWLRVPVSGFLVHPGVLRYTLAVRPLFGQHANGGLDRRTRARSLGLDASVSFFRARRLSLTLQATESSGSSRGDFGTRNDFDNADFTAIASFRDRYFPMTVTYSDRSVRDNWESAYSPIPIERDQRASRLRAEIRNKKLTTLLERSEYRDLRGTSDHEATTGQARHRTEWGKGSSLVSVVNLYRRRGSSAIRRTSWSERATIMHTRHVSTGLSFGRQSWSRAEQSGRNLSYDLTTRYSPSRDVNASLSIAGQRFSSGLSGSLTRLRLAPTLHYGIRLPADSRLRLSGTVGTEKLSRTLPGDVFLDVLEEPHEVDETRRFTLDQLRADPRSIEIWDEARTLLYQRDIDYRIVEAGPYLEVHILPGSRAQEGEVVLVSYRYRSLAAEDIGLFYVNYEASLRVKDFSLRHGRRQRSQEVSGSAGTLVDPTDVDVWLGAGFARRTRFGVVSLDASRRTRSASEIEYTSDELRGEVALPALRTLESRLRASTSHTVAGELETTTSSAGGSLSWPASSTLRVTAGVDGWIWERDEQSPETFLAGHVMVTWRFGEVSTVLTFDQVRRSNGLSHRENRWSARVVRRF